ncbi:MAG: D-glycero-beta-D-manno-heptose 1,7-bisphosphate 7-phosphatase [Acidiferrobacter sp.]
MRLVILDRDGVINEDSDAYIKSPDEWMAIPGSLEAIARLSHEGFHVVVATNQSGVGRGLFNIDMLNRIHNRMVDEVSAKGGQIDAIFFCPHTPADHCACRKPLPGLFVEIAQRLKINLSGAFAVGDSWRDIDAARQAQTRPVLVRTGKGLRTLAAGHNLDDVLVFNDLAHFADTLLSGGVPAAV